MKLPGDRCYRVKKTTVLTGDVPEWIKPGSYYWGHTADALKSPPTIALENPNGEGDFFPVSGAHVDLVDDTACCTCERWPLRGGVAEPGSDVLRGVTIDYDSLDPNCRLHGHLANG